MTTSRRRIASLLCLVTAAAGLSACSQPDPDPAVLITGDPVEAIPPQPSTTVAPTTTTTTTMYYK